MYPLNFLEFLEATDNGSLITVLIENHSSTAIATLLHEKLLGLLRHYLFLGGMPEVIQTYIKTDDLGAARVVQKEILKAYERDFSKYTTPTQAVRVAEIWRSIPSHLARENKKFKYSDVRKSGRASQFESGVEWLRSAGLMYASVNVTTSKLPLAGYEQPEYFKAYIFDCGLLGAMVDISSKSVVLGDLMFSEYNGAFVENYVATELAKKSEAVLHYWISEGIAEVDFLLVYDQAILPLEVKSGLNRNIKSLRLYADKFKPPRIYRTSPRNYDCHDDFVNIPLYAIGLFPESR